jgi:hypothetical protein
VHGLQGSLGARGLGKERPRGAARGSNAEGAGAGALERGHVAAGIFSFGLALFELNFLHFFE